MEHTFNQSYQQIDFVLFTSYLIYSYRHRGRHCINYVLVFALFMITSFSEAPSSNFRNFRENVLKQCIRKHHSLLLLFSYTPQTVTVHVSSILSKRGNERIPILYYSGLKVTSLHIVAVIFLNSKNIIPKPWLSGAERYRRHGIYSIIS